MAIQTEIEWTDATRNPVSGCTKVSPGCDHCYAGLRRALPRSPGHPFESGFDLTLRPHKLDEPLRWRRRARVRQFDERPVPQGHPGLVPRSRVRDDGAGRLAPVPCAHKRSPLLRRYVNERYGGGRAPPYMARDRSKTGARFDCDICRRLAPRSDRVVRAIARAWVRLTARYPLGHCWRRERPGSRPVEVARSATCVTSVALQGSPFSSSNGAAPP